MSKPKKRRARGTGSIFFSESRNRWIGRKVVGTTAAGKTLFREVWGKTQTEVVKKLAQLEAPGPDTTVAAWAARWMAAQSVRPATKANHATAFDLHILPVIGHLRVRDVKPSHVESLAAALAKKDLHANTIRLTLACGRALFTAAVKDEMIGSNPFSRARKPKAKRKAIDPFAPDELRRIISEARSPAYVAGGLVAVLAGTGCRTGEAAALNIEDWDGAAGTLAITKTYDPTHGLGPPKSERSLRTIVVPAAVRPIIEAAIGGRTSGVLFPSELGHRAARPVVRRTLDRILARLGLPRKNVHQLRHSVATALVASGCPIADVAKYLGDTAATIVANYLHSSGASPAAALDALLAPKPS